MNQTVGVMMIGLKGAVATTLVVAGIAARHKLDVLYAARIERRGRLCIRQRSVQFLSDARSRSKVGTRPIFGETVMAKFSICQNIVKLRSRANRAFSRSDSAKMTLITKYIFTITNRVGMLKRLGIISILKGGLVFRCR